MPTHPGSLPSNGASKQIGNLIRTPAPVRSPRAAGALHIERIRENERARIARELHDEFGQALTALKMDIARLPEQYAPLDVDGVVAKVDAMFSTLRRIASQLRPRLLDDVGLVAALEWQAQDFVTRTGVKCRFRCRGTPRNVDRDRSVAVYRIIQEILTNITRHACASHVQITLDIGRDCLRLEVHDDGVGMPRSARGGLGIAGMRERAEAFGGTVTFSRRPPSGTRVRTTLPLRGAGAESGPA
jgi:signal transduction histidine kinase